MSVVQRVVEAGGFVTRARLLAACPRAEVDAALARGDVVVAGRGRYALPVVGDAVRRAHGLHGVLALRSAALHHGWEVLVPPEVPEVAVPRGRKVGPDRRAGVRLLHTPLEPLDVVDDIVTGVEATLRMCLARLPRREALAVADSALRRGVPPSTLRRAALTVSGPGAPQARWVSAHADDRSAGPFESALREICLDVPGLSVVPQVVLRSARQTVRPDLVDRELDLVCEADSFAWHGDRTALARDARRYDLLVADGWVVLRFAYEDVLGDPAWCVGVLSAVVQRRTGRQPCGCPTA
ncbi:hypothetical protein [Nocardioides litoris]|uniref:hypothetical protein n=1 Tax=Nocardioides litoris TaxID=1926648 RepID=UPI001122B2D2|nr:hypothetical protein [Nocardioides litoris]